MLWILPSFSALNNQLALVTTEEIDKDILFRRVIVRNVVTVKYKVVSSLHLFSLNSGNNSNTLLSTQNHPLNSPAATQGSYHYLNSNNNHEALSGPRRCR